MKSATIKVFDNQSLKGLLLLIYALIASLQGFSMHADKGYHSKSNAGTSLTEDHSVINNVDTYKRAIVDEEIFMAPGNTALDFNAFVDGHVVFPELGSPTLPSDITIEAWINLQGSFGVTTIASWVTDAGAYFSFGLDDGNPMVSLIDPNVSVFETYVAPTSVPSFIEDVHVALTGNPTDGYNFYINGELSYSTGTLGSFFPVSGSDQFYIGITFDENGIPLLRDGFDGTIDELRVWDFVRSEAQIKSDLFKSFTATQTGLVAAFNFDEGTGTSVSDITNTFTGTVTNLTESSWVESDAGLFPASDDPAVLNAVTGTATSGILSLTGFGNYPADPGDSVVFAGNGGSGTTYTTDLIAGFNTVSSRLEAEFFVQPCNEAIGTDEFVTFNFISDIPDSDITYYLLYRSNSEFDLYLPASNSTAFIIGNSYSFRIPVDSLKTGWYTMGRSIEAPVNALDFQGFSNNYVDVPDFPAITPELTIEAWVKRQGNSQGTIVGWGGSFEGENTRFFIDALGALSAEGLGGNTVSTTDTIPYDIWTHVALTKSGTDINFYINGQLSDNATLDIDIPESSMYVGATDDTTGPFNYFTGQLDEVRIWRVERSPTDLQTNLYNTLTGQEASLEAYYKFDLPENTMGNLLPDQSGNNRYGNLNNFGFFSFNENFVESGALREFNNALKFEGFDDQVNTATIIPVTDNHTVEFWVNKQFSGTSREILFRLGDVNNDGTAVQAYLENNRINVWIRDNGGFSTKVFQGTETNFGDFSWHHVAYTFDTSTDELLIYVDGKEETVSEQVNSGSFVGYTNPHVLTLASGPFVDSFESPFNGLIDEFRIWNEVLTPETIRDYLITDDLNTPPHPNLGDLLVHYSFDEGLPGADNSAITTVPDLSGNNHTGTLNNMALNGNLSNFLISDIFDQPGEILLLGNEQQILTGNIPQSADNTQMGAVRVSETVQREFQITNTGTGDIRNLIIAANSSFGLGDFSTVIADDMLAPFDTATFTISYTSNNQGVDIGTLSVNSTEESNFYSLSVAGYEDQLGPGNSVGFDGVDGFYNLGDGFAFDVTDAFTIEAWVESDIAGFNPIISKQSVQTFNQGWALSINGNQIQLELAAESLGSIIVRSIDQVPLSDWSHIAVTYDGLGDGAGISMYLNGKPVATDIVQNNLVSPGTLANIETTYLGRGGFMQVFTGDVDEVRIWSGTRTAEDIANNVFGSIDPATAGLIGYYRMNLPGVDLLNLVGDFGIFESFSTDAPNINLSDAAIYNNPDFLSLNDQSAIWPGVDSTISANLKLKEAGFLLDTGDKVFVAHDNTETTDDTFVNDRLGAVSPLVEAKLERNWLLHFADTVSDMNGGQVELSFFNQLPDSSKTYYLLAAPDQLSDFELANQLGYYFDNDSIRFLVEANDVANTAYYTMGRSATYPGNALAFDGVNDSVVVQGFGHPDLYTYEIWIKPAELNREQTIFMQSGDLQSTRLILRMGNFITFSAANNGASVNVSSTTQAVLGEWMHIAVSNDASNTRLYINGNLEDTQPYTDQSDFSGTLFFGVDDLGGTTQFNGTMEDFRLWGDVRTAGEIAANLENMLGNNDPNFFLNYRFDQDGTQDVLSSFSGFGAFLSGRLFNFDYNGSTSGWVTSDAFEPAVSGNQNALNFDGIDDYINIGNPSNLNFGTGDFTIEAWVNIPSSADLSEAPVIAMNGATGTGQSRYIVAVDPTGQVFFEVSDGSVDTTITTTGNAVNDDSWHHIAVVREGATGRIYIDGLLAEEETVSAGSFDDSENFIIGARNENEGGIADAGFFEGTLDELRVWNSALTLEEIRTHINVELDPVAATDLVSYYRFNEGTPGGNNVFSTTVSDSKGNNTGLLNGFDLNGGLSNFIMSTLFQQFAPLLQVELVGGNELISNSTSALGVILEGDSVSVQIALTNIGLEDLNINAIDLPAGYTLERNLADLILTPFESDTVEIKFVSTTSGIQSDNFSVDSDNSQGVFQVTFELNVYPNLAGAANAIRFDGSATQFASSASNTSDLTSASFSVEFWANRSDNTTDDFVLGIGNSANPNEALRVGFKAGDVVSLGFGSDDHDVNWVDPTNGWHHYAFTFNNTNNERRIFIDGIEIGTTDIAGNAFLGSGNIVVGSSGSGGQFNGDIDELRIWNVTLDEATIRKNLASKLDNSNLPVDSLVAYYRFDDGSNTTIFDLTSSYQLSIIGGTKEISDASFGDKSIFSFTDTEISNNEFDEFLKVANVSNPANGAFLYRVDGIPTGSTNGEFGDFVFDRSYGVYAPGNTFEVRVGYVDQPGEDSLRIVSRPAFSNDWTGASSIFDTDITNDSIYARNQVSSQFYVAAINYPNLPDAGTALTFNGTNAHVSIGNIETLDFTNEGTIEAWFFANSISVDEGEQRRIISQVRADEANPATTPFDLYVDTVSEKLIFSFGDGTSLTQNISSSSIIRSGRWYHTAVTWDADTIRLLINGLEEAKAEKEFASFRGLTPIQIGASDALGTAGNWDGLIDEVRIWSGAIDVNQIQQFYTTNQLANSGDIFSLAHYYRFDDGTNSGRLTDVINYENGTLNNFNTASDWVSSDALTDNVAEGVLADSLALVRLYDNADGENWLNNTNWTSAADPADWFGVNVTNRRVDSLDLSNNGLKGTVPAFAGLELENLASLRLQNNELDSIGDISSLTLLTEISLENNLFQFDDLEPVAGISGISYIPQLEVFIGEDITVSESEPITIDGTVGGSANDYQWFKDGVAIADEISPVLTIASAQFEDDATYRVEVTSSLVPGLTLSSNEVVVVVSSLDKDIASLTQFYNDTDGDNWTINDGWLSGDITTWQGVVMNESQSRVVGVSLPGNNLSGEVSDAITGVLNLDSLDISDNKITGIPDMTVLSEFTTLKVSKNQIQFADLEQNLSVTEFEYLEQTIPGTEEFLRIARGENITFSIELEGSQNQYQWFIDGDLIPDGDSTHLVLEDLSITDIGQYTCSISSDLVSDLVIESVPSNLSVITSINGTVTGINDEQITSGTVLGLRIRPNNQPYDTLPQIAEIIDGTYSYDSVELADYIFVATTDDIRFIPTYSESSFLWDEADTIRLRDAGQAANIRMVLDPDETVGAGQVGGIFEEEFTEETDGRIEARRRVRRVGVALRRRRSSNRPQNDEFELVAYTQTDDEGQFAFDNLPSGVYRISFEFPGIPLDLNSFVEFEIPEGDEETRIVLEAVAEEDGQIVVNDVSPDPTNVNDGLMKLISIYPNPATSTVTVDFSNLSGREIDIRLIDYSGKNIMERIGINRSGETQILDISRLENGLYLLQMIDRNDQTISTTFKLIKQD
ncbi:MAG: LamG-like jellyroll fold domain-containing protein [Bacteroidota bacterium]